MSHYQILTLNQISRHGLHRFPARALSPSARRVEEPDAILVRSHDMHAMAIPASVKAIGRAGAGTNNIPVAAMSQRGVPVFNAPGANANAVKELVLAALLIAARNCRPALRYVGAPRSAGAGPRGAGRGGQEAVRRRRAAAPHARHRRPGRDRQPGRRHRHQARHEGRSASTRRSRSTRRGGCRPSVRRAHSIEERPEARRFRHAARAAAAGDAPPDRRARGSRSTKPGAVLLNFARDGDRRRRRPCWPRCARSSCATTSRDFPSAALLREPRRRRAAAPRRLDGRGRGQLRGDGGRPGARVPGARHHRQRGQLPQRRDAARVALPGRDRQRQRAEHAGADLDRPWRTPASTSTTW